MLQRRMRVGYTRAARLIDKMEERGIISGFDGSKARNVLIDESALPRVLAELRAAPDDEDSTSAGGDSPEADDDATEE